MPVLEIYLNAEGLLENVKEKDLIHLETPITVAALEAGMESGRPSVAFVFDLPDGKTVLAETSMLLFQAAARAFAARFGDLIKLLNEK